MREECTAGATIVMVRPGFVDVAVCFITCACAMVIA